MPTTTIAMLLLSFLAALLSAASAYQVVEQSVKFTLYNRNVSAVLLNEETLCSINPNNEIKILVHGKGSSPDPSWIADVTESYLQLGDYNVIQVDWSELSGQSDPTPIYKATDAAYYLAKLIQRIYKRLSVPLENFHLAGHSLGAHVVGFAGKHVRRALNASLGRVTGLDPANDDFSFDPDSENGLQRTDALLVVAIHTDDTGLGSRGNIDFHANGGSHPQPGCEQNICSHLRSCEYFNEALQNPDGFVATKCDSYQDYLSGACDGSDKVALGNSLLGHEGDYYFLTNAEPPYSQS